MDERTLVVRAQAGDREAFDRIVLAYQARLRGHVARTVPSSQDTYDLVQEVFLEAYRQLSKVDPEKPFGPWLWSICRHRVSDYFRRRYRRGPAVESLGLVDEALARLAAEPDPDEEEGSDRRLTALEGCVKRLDDGHRQILSLRYHHGLSLKDLAEKLRRSSAGLAMLLLRLREKLEDCVRNRLREEIP
jgi:RNA polymerase sigma-70 factor (ECF subfamily)